MKATIRQKLAARKRREASFSSLATEEGASFVETIADGEPTPSDRAILGERARTIRGALSSIPALYSVVLALRYEEDLAFEDIAQKLNRSVNTVRSQHRRGLQLLRGILGDTELASS